MSLFPWLSDYSTHRQKIEDQQRKIAELDRENNILAAEVRDLRQRLEGARDIIRAAAISLATWAEKDAEAPR
ncbi:septum formation initiator family protein [Pseudochelatococcus sp. B33]